MRTIIALSLTALAVVSTACSSSGVRVSTTTAPDASLAGRHTFRVLTAPQRRVDAPSLPAHDPMLDNSITNQHLRSDLIQGLEQKGFAPDPANPDFLVAYYAGTMAKMDTSYWNPDPFWRYGYRGYGYRQGTRFGWAWPYYSASPYPSMQVREYTQGSVIVDVIDPTTKELLWRGQGVASVSNDPTTYANELNRTVAAILKKFPRA